MTKASRTSRCGGGGELDGSRAGGAVDPAASAVRLACFTAALQTERLGAVGLSSVGDRGPVQTCCARCSCCLPGSRFSVRVQLALLIFATFSVLWTPVALPLSGPPFSLSHMEIRVPYGDGLFGLANQGRDQRVTGFHSC